MTLTLTFLFLLGLRSSRLGFHSLSARGSLAMFVSVAMSALTVSN